MPLEYAAFLKAKVPLVAERGFHVEEAELPVWLKPHARLAVKWMLLGGCRAVFASFGLAKTSMQLAACWCVLKWLWRSGDPDARGLIVIPLGVRHDFARDAASMGISIRFVRSTIECWGPGLYLTNYETFRERRIDLTGFKVVALDEAACLRGMGGTKTFRVAANDLDHVPFRFVATATPSPNEYIELLSYAQVLGVMDIGQAKTRFFRRNSEKADQLTLHPHKEAEFWMWVASWALFISKPSDLGCSDEGYDLPPMQVTWHEIETPRDFDDGAGIGPGQQARLFRETKISVQNQAREKRTSLMARVARAAEICARDGEDHRILWHDLNAERDLIVQAMPDAFVLDGAMDDEAKEAAILGFADGFFPRLAAKPVMAGAGCNFQRHCRKATFVGIGFKFHDFIQAIHRIYRFGQTGVVEIDVIYAEAERGVRAELERRWAQHNRMVAMMGEIIRQYGLSSAAMADQLTRAMGVERIVALGGAWKGSSSPEGGGTGAIPAWSMVHNDCVDEVSRMASDSVDLIVTSIPFSTQYEYSPNYCDFSHTDNNAHFWRQMDYLIPQLLRVLKPGRDACIHVKDRITPGGVNGLGFQTLEPFSDECRAAFRRHGFALLGTITNLTDVVRENNQTYRLGWTEQLKDGTRQGVGVPEQIILLRKPPSDRSDGFADQRVVKARPDYVWVSEDRAGEPAVYEKALADRGLIKPVEQTGYSRSRWQVDAGAFRRSNGDRLLAPGDWVTWENMAEVYRLWKAKNLDEVYDFEQHVLIGERLDFVGKMPSKFSLLPVHAWGDWVWSDVMQARGLNTEAQRTGAEKHLCPLPFDIVNRLIVQRSEPGDLVFDPFAGIGTTPYCALKLGRRGLGVELSPDYWAAAAKNCALAEADTTPPPTLFDLLEEAGAPGAGAAMADGVAA